MRVYRWHVRTYLVHQLSEYESNPAGSRSSVSVELAFVASSQWASSVCLVFLDYEVAKIVVCMRIGIVTSRVTLLGVAIPSRQDVMQPM